MLFSAVGVSRHRYVPPFAITVSITFSSLPPSLYFLSLAVSYSLVSLNSYPFIFSIYYPLILSIRLASLSCISPPRI